MRHSLLISALVAGVLLALPAVASAASTTVVISEFQFRGVDGNDEFVELRNISGQPVNVGNWDLQGCAGASGLPTTRTTIPAGTSIPAGRAYLIANAASATFAGQADRTYGNGLADDGGVRIIDAADVPVDGVGSANGAVDNCREGAGLTIPTTNGTARAFERKAEGTQDTDDNVADFDGPQAADPQNSGSNPTADPAPTVTGSSPANNATGVAQNASIDVTFSEPVTVDGSGFTLSCNPSGAQAVTVTPQSPTVVRVDPQQDLPRGETCTLTVAAGAVHDVDTNDPPDTMNSNATVRFTTIGLLLRIHEIQGAAHISPYDDRAVLDVPGVVTAIQGNGFWIQDTQPDTDRDTSEGIFVFTSSNPRSNPLVVVGTPLKVSGTVDEFRPGGSGGLGNLTTTEIVRPQIAAGTPAGTVTPTAIGTGSGAILPPTEIIEDQVGDVETTPGFLFDPESDGLDFHESLEGMLVSIQDPEVVGPTTSNEELAVLASGFGSPRTERGGVLIRPDDFNPERIILDDAVLLSQQQTIPPANVGDTLVGPIEAVVDYSFGNPKYQVTKVPVVKDNGLQPEVTEAPRANQLAMASMNVENLAADDPTLSDEDLEAKFARLAGQLVTNLRSPDIVAVEEIQDSNGTTNNGNVDAGPTYDRFIAAIAAADGPTYEYRQIDPVNNADGGAPGGNIRVGFLFRTDRGLEFVDRRGGTATNETDVAATRKGARLTFSPGRLQDEDATTFAASRKPLVGEFLWRGRTVFAIANHFNSKGGDDPLFGHRQPPVAVSEVQRHQQAEVVAGFVKRVLAADPRAAIAVLGDLNDFDFSETLDIVEGSGLNNLMDTLPANERYSYVFDGNSQVLDQILVSDELMTPHPEYDSVHVNAEFADQASDHDPQVARVVVRGTGNAK
jgi:predicted extracellular nuclease